MGRRERYKKVTTVGKDIFGNKRIETRWVREGSGCGLLILIGIILFFVFRGCS
jgi:hypothetical protein